MYETLVATMHAVPRNVSIHANPRKMKKKGKFLFRKQGYKSCRKHQQNELKTGKLNFEVVVHVRGVDYCTAGAHICWFWFAL